MHISPNVLQISLSGRIVSAHKRQLKIPVDSRRGSSRRFVFNGESPSTSAQPCSISSNSNSNDNNNTASTSHSNKRKRNEEEVSDDSESDFYGFAADSSLYDEEQVPERGFSPRGDVQSDRINEVVRRATEHNHAGEPELVIIESLRMQ